MDRARRRATLQLIALAHELRDARLNAGRTQADVARATGISTSELSRIELGRTVGLRFETVAMIGSAVGLDVTLRAYPGVRLLRDEAQVHLLRALRERLGARWSWRYEVPVASGDQRAWDAVGRCRVTSTGLVVEAETRIRDVQAVLRRVSLKREAAGSPRIAVLVADTRNNRAVVAAAADVLAAELPIGTRAALHALQRGLEPHGDCLIMLRTWRSTAT